MVEVERGLRMDLGLELVVASHWKRATFPAVPRLDFKPNSTFSLTRYLYHGLPT